MCAIVEFFLGLVLLGSIEVFADTFCPDTDGAKFYCKSFICLDEVSDGENAFKTCMECYKKNLNQYCEEKIESYHLKKMQSYEANRIHNTHFVEDDLDEVVPLGPDTNATDVITGMMAIS